MKRKLDGRRFAMLVHLGLFIGMTIGAGCYRVQYLASEHTTGAPQTVQMDFFLAGAVGKPSIDLRTICQHTISAVEVRQGWRQVLISIGTLGIYTPLELEVWCGPVSDGVEAAQ